ncbi:hypothetical protein [Nitrospira sp. KM1]|uniref:hypothetical protein n=1 Tax=Nitrospira sp. KM1 TaxID=1936990 RepID=UPI0015664A47|nr:hypothetical protein [Nitrospira sp. KM1]
MQHVEELGHELSEILNSAQAQLSNYSFASRGVMIGDMIRAVAIARADLLTLHVRLEQIGDAASKQAHSDFEHAGREAEIAREVEESIQRDIGAPTLPSSARTGSDIGKAPSAGPEIGRTPKTGSAIGNEGRTGEDIGFSPRNSRDIGGNGPTGFEIGATGRAGPMIGESSFNREESSEVDSSLQRSTVGSNLQDSTVGSNLRPSSIGSSLEDSTVGSSFGGSSVSSSLQNRGTGSPR